jgi:MYXO-CTERM domain-containing protein
MSQQTTVPEPPAYGMLMVGVLVLLGARRVLRRKA